MSDFFEKFANLINEEAGTFAVAPPRVATAASVARAVSESFTEDRPNAGKVTEGGSKAAQITEAQLRTGIARTRADRAKHDPLRESKVQRQLSEALETGRRMLGRSLTIEEELDLEITLLGRVPATGDMSSMSESAFAQMLGESDLGNGRPDLRRRGADARSHRLLSESAVPGRVVKTASELAEMSSADFRRTMGEVDGMINFGGRRR